MVFKLNKLNKLNFNLCNLENGCRHRSVQIGIGNCKVMHIVTLFSLDNVNVDNCLNFKYSKCSKDISGHGTGKIWIRTSDIFFLSSLLSLLFIWSIENHQKFTNPGRALKNVITRRWLFRKIQAGRLFLSHVHFLLSEGLQNPEMSMCVNMMCTTAVSSSEDCFLKMSTRTCSIFNSCVHAKTNNNKDLTIMVSMAIVATLVIVEGEHISTGWWRWWFVHWWWCWRWWWWQGGDNDENDDSQAGELILEAYHMINWSTLWFLCDN